MKTSPIPLPGTAFLVAWIAQMRLARGRGVTFGSALAATPALLGASWLGLGSLAQFRARQTSYSPVTLDRAHALVEEGPNAVTRNPMYVALALLLAAHATARRSLAAALPVAAFVAVVDRFQIPAEEAALAERFGGSYRRHRARVPRWWGL
ncbi:MAG: isoprenylcysteine carboxylmethyltransferase family protein [Bowdeniella nasicola]|nr:isoprenylcysteine carboxylmethyltransferase family protein [Bowdeniella nasicola]